MTFSALWTSLSEVIAYDVDSVEIMQIEAPGPYTFDIKSARSLFPAKSLHTCHADYSYAVWQREDQAEAIHLRLNARI